MENIAYNSRAAGMRKGKRNAAGITAVTVCAAAVLYTLLFSDPGAEGYIVKLTAPLLCVILIAAEDIAERLSGVRLPDGLGAALRLFLLACLTGGKTFELYTRLPFYDKLLHTASGVLAALTGARICRCIYPRSGALTAAFTGLLTALALGYMWEIFEYFGDTLFSMNSQCWRAAVIGTADSGWIVSDPRGSALPDTMDDMIVNLLGAILPFTVIAASFTPFKSNGAVGSAPAVRE